MTKKNVGQFSDTKRNKDLATIRDLFSVIPRPLVDQVLEEALADRILTHHTDCLAAAENVYRSALFYLYDKNLCQMLDDLFRKWGDTWCASRTTRHEYLTYIDRAAQAKRALAGLTKYLHEEYPDFDLAESDVEASRKYWEMMNRAKKKMQELFERSSTMSEHDIEVSVASDAAGDVDESQDATGDYLSKVARLKPAKPPTGRASEVIKVLLLSANPIDSPLKIDEEFRAIDQKIHSSEHRDHVKLVKHGAVRLNDVAGLLMRHKPHIVHFSGHGSATGIELTGSDGNGRLVPPDALAKIFHALKDNVRIVLLNTCYSARQAKAIVGEIECAVGMSDKIEDDAAIAFAAAFYEALGYGRSVQSAFDLALVQLEATGSDRSLAMLHKGRKVKPSEIILVNPSHPQ